MFIEASIKLSNCLPNDAQKRLAYNLAKRWVGIISEQPNEPFFISEQPNEPFFVVILNW